MLVRQSVLADRAAVRGVRRRTVGSGTRRRFDPRNPSHKMLMSVLGGMSESERQHVQARVRAAMDVQVRQRGSAPGRPGAVRVQVVDAGPHPNPRKAAEGFRLRVLAIDEASAGVVRRIFAEYLDGNGDRAIANGLNRDGIPCPSARRPDQNRHRLADGWQGSTVRAILDNPRYTGYAVFGRWTRQEVLADPDDVAAGHVTRFRRAEPENVVRSREQAHPAIVSVEMFTQPSCCAHPAPPVAWPGDASSNTVSTPPSTPTCSVDGSAARTARGRWRAPPSTATSYYRCVTRRLAPGSPALATHPRNVYLAGTCGAAGAERVDRGTVRPRQHRPDRRRAARVPGQRPAAGEPRSIETRSSGGSPTPRRASRASEPRSRPEPTRPRSSSQSTPRRSSAPLRKPNSGCSARPGPADRRRGLRDGRRARRRRRLADAGEPGPNAQDLRQPAPGDRSTITASGRSM